MIRVYLFAYKAILYKKSLENKLIKLKKELTNKGYPTSRYSIDFDGDYPGLSALLA